MCASAPRMTAMFCKLPVSKHCRRPESASDRPRQTPQRGWSASAHNPGSTDSNPGFRFAPSGLQSGPSFETHRTCCETRDLRRTSTMLQKGDTPRLSTGDHLHSIDAGLTTTQGLGLLGYGRAGVQAMLGGLQRLRLWLLCLFVVAQTGGVMPSVYVDTVHEFAHADTIVVSAVTAGGHEHRDQHHPGIHDEHDQCC